VRGWQHTIGWLFAAAFITAVYWLVFAAPVYEGCRREGHDATYCSLLVGR
jgi:hypothetical protein